MKMVHYNDVVCIKWGNYSYHALIAQYEVPEHENLIYIYVGHLSYFKYNYNAIFGVLPFNFFPKKLRNYSKTTILSNVMEIKFMLSMPLALVL